MSADTTQTDPLDATPVQTAEELDRARLLSESPVAAGVPEVPGFHLVQPLGEGAYGAVWLAREQRTGRQVAIKFFTHRRGLDWSLLSREVEKLAQLDASRNIVNVLDVGWQSDPPYYVMEYLEHSSLDAYLTDGALPPAEAVRIIRAVCQALVHAHGRGILHCDLKPANVLLDHDFEPRLCDFGQSRLPNEQNPALGTLFYMAPEQADLKAVPDARWDVYALGALFYHLLFGKPPHRTPENEARLREAQTLEERLRIYREIVSQSPHPLAIQRAKGIDRRLLDVVARCLQPDPERRYANAQAVLDVLYIRDRQLSVKPFVALGGFLPGLLLFAMFVFTANSMTSAVNTAEQNLTRRAQESNAQAANILAESIDREIAERFDQLQQLASDETLRREIVASQVAGWIDRDAFQGILQRKKDEVDARRERLEQTVDPSWFFVDSNGYQRWRGPHDEFTYDRNWSHRDYFHGHGKEYDPDADLSKVRPVEHRHVSLRFRSRATKLPMVALSVPVWHHDEKRVIGVLARTAHLGELMDSYESSLTEQGVSRSMALVDNRQWWLLESTELDSEFFARVSDLELEELRLAEEHIAIVDGHDETQLINTYTDPLARLDEERFGGEWLAAFRSIGDRGWTAVVQEKKANVLTPVYEMEQTIIRYAWFALGVSGVVVAVIWYFVLKSVNERGIRHWSRPAASSSDSTGST